MFDLEIWMIGTPTELDSAMTALNTAGRITGASKTESLYGTDAGRVRRYLRIAVPTPTAVRVRARPGSKPSNHRISASGTAS